MYGRFYFLLLHVIRAVLFDSGGVIIRNVLTKDFPNFFASRYGVSPEKFGEYHREAWRLIRVGKISEQQYWDHIFAAYQLPSDANRAHELYVECLTLIPGVLDIIRELRERWSGILCLCNNEGKEFDIARDKKFHFFQYFDHLFHSWKMGMPKRDPAFFSTVLKTIGCAPEECLLIDDQENNIGVAKEQGIQTYLFTNAESLRSTLQSYGVL